MSKPGISDANPADASWDVEVGELVVGRGWSWKPEPLRGSAERDYKAKMREDGAPPPFYSISTFGLRRKDGETTEDLVSRLMAHMSRAGVRARYVGLVTATELQDAGFDLHLSEPPPDHYDLPLGLTLDELRTDELSHVFNVRERRRMPV